MPEEIRNARITPQHNDVLRKHLATRIVQRITNGPAGGIIECTEVIRGNRGMRMRVVMPSISQWRRWAKDAEVE